MVNNKRVSLVLPCRNEEAALKVLLDKLDKVSRTIDEVIVVDNLSADKTQEVAKSFGAKVLVESRRSKGIGYGYALATGIKNTSGDYIVCMDGDGSYPVWEIKRIINYLETQRLDFISCNRLVVDNLKKMSGIRMMGVRFLNSLILFLFGFLLEDCLSGMWVFRKSVISELELYEGGWNFSLEIKLGAFFSKNINFAEYPISYHDREFDQSKQSIIRTGFEHSLFLLHKRLDSLRWVLNPSARVSLLRS